MKRYVKTIKWIVLFTVCFSAAFILSNNYTQDAKEKVSDALKETLSADGYSFVCNITVYREKEEYIGNIKGEKYKDTAHVLWQIGEDTTEVYKIDQCYYRKNNDDPWFFTENISFQDAVELFQELDFLKSVIPSEFIDEAEYLGREKIDKKYFKKYQGVSYQTFGENWENRVYTFWVKNKKIYHFEALFSEKSSNIIWCLEADLDYAPISTITPPIQIN